MPQRRFLPLALATLTAQACVITTGSGTDDDGTEPPPSYAPFECPPWQASSQAEVDQLVADVAAQLEAEGTIDPVAAWDDAATFAALVEGVYDAAGCPLPDGVSQQALHDHDAPNFYCGYGHGPSSIKRPPVSPCLNDACRDHDGCYAMCSARPGGCSWTDVTKPCDEGFLADADLCIAEDFVDKAVLGLAHWLNNKDRVCLDSLICPPYGNLGQGLCSLDPTDPECLACLAYFDPDGTCLQGTECDTAYCYAANCDVFACYGESPPSGIWNDTCPSYSGTPANHLWDLHLIGAVVPATTPAGLAWDLGDRSVTAPDVYVRVTLPGASTANTATTHVVHDNHAPEFNKMLFEARPPADFAEGIHLEVFDSDVFFNDEIGTCTLPATADPFCNADLALPCTAAGLSVSIRLQPSE